MKKNIAIEKARMLYKTAKKAVQYDTLFNSTCVIFESEDKFVQVNTFKETGRKEAFTVPRSHMVKEVFQNTIGYAILDNCNHKTLIG